MIYQNQNNIWNNTSTSTKRFLPIPESVFTLSAVATEKLKNKTVAYLAKEDTANYTVIIQVIEGKEKIRTKCLPIGEFIENYGQ